MQSQCGNLGVHEAHDWPAPTTGTPVGYVWHCQGVAARPFACLLYAWEELDELAVLVDEKMSEGYLRTTPRWIMLNSLRTSLREAQWQLRSDGLPSPLLQVITELLRLQRWKDDAVKVIISWERAHALLEEHGQGGRLGASMADTVHDFVQQVLTNGWDPVTERPLTEP